MQHLQSRALALVISLATLTACGATESTRVEAAAGQYVLQTANGQPAPALIHSAPYEGTTSVLEVHVVADTINLLDGARYEQRAHLEARVDGQLVSRSTWVDRGVVTRNGSIMHFESDYLQNVAFDGTLSPSGQLTVKQNLAGEGTDDLYTLRRQQ